MTVSSHKTKRRFFSIRSSFFRQYAEINYILEDLNDKLNIKIVPAPVLPFGKKKATNENKNPSSNVTLLARIDSQRFMRQVKYSKKNSKLILFFGRLCHHYRTYFKHWKICILRCKNRYYNISAIVSDSLTYFIQDIDSGRVDVRKFIVYFQSLLTIASRGLKKL